MNEKGDRLLIQRLPETFSAKEDKEGSCELRMTKDEQKQSGS